MSNNKQSSVEWYIEKILDLDYKHAKGLITLGVWSKRKNALIEQAKAMHKEEIEEAFANGVYDEYEYHINNEPRKNTEQYYSETFGGNK